MQDNKDIFSQSDKSTENQNEEFKTKIFNKNIEDILSNNSFEDLYSKSDYEEAESKTSEPDMSQNKKINKKTNKKRKNKKGVPTIVKLLIILLISFLLAAVILFSAVDILGITFNKNIKTDVEIKQGYSTEQIANELANKGVIKYPILFRLYSKIKGADGNYQYGVYEIRDSQSYNSIINTLNQPGNSGSVTNVTIPEGYSVKKIGALFEKKGVCSQTEFISAVKNAEFDYSFIKDIPTQSVYYRLEGYLYPDTYTFFINEDGKSGEECAKKAVDKMLLQMESILTDDVIANAKKRGYSVHQILTMASVVELEASGNPNDMAKVAQVFYNRLKWTDQPARLGSTPTADYPDSRYDTNQYEGLPPGPLCSPSKEAINAALNPDTSIKANYFVTDKNMKFYYTNTLNEHNALIERLKSEGLWN